MNTETTNSDMARKRAPYKADSLASGMKIFRENYRRMQAERLAKAEAAARADDIALFFMELASRERRAARQQAIQAIQATQAEYTNTEDWEQALAEAAGLTYQEARRVALEASARNPRWAEKIKNK